MAPAHRASAEGVIQRDTAVRVAAQCHAVWSVRVRVSEPICNESEQENAQKMLDYFETIRHNIDCKLIDAIKEECKAYWMHALQIN